MPPSRPSHLGSKEISWASPRAGVGVGGVEHGVDGLPSAPPLMTVRSTCTAGAASPAAIVLGCGDTNGNALVSASGPG